MSFLSTAELEQMIDTASRYLSDTCDIYRMSSDANAYGSINDEWKLVSSTFCKLSAVVPYALNEFRTSSGVEDLGLVLVSLPNDISVTVADRLKIHNQMYAVVGIVETTIKICTHVQCRKLGTQ
jgi:hypothetical protein